MKLLTLLFGFLVLTFACGNGSQSTTPSTQTIASRAPSLQVGTFNLLHGLNLGGEACPPETNDCEAGARLEIAFAEIERAGCPDLVGLQEVGPSQQELVPPMLTTFCDGHYRVVSDDSIPLPVTQWILSSIPITSAKAKEISGISRTVQLVATETEIGPVDFVTTHFAARSVDDVPCTDELCTDVCEPGELAGDCNAREVLEFINEFGTNDTLTVVTGDLNAEIDEPRIAAFVDAGYADAWLGAGEPECDPSTGEGCTSGNGGRGIYDGLDDPTLTFSSRIDFILARSSSCDVVMTGATNLSATPVEEPLKGLYWASDHAGVAATLSC